MMLATATNLDESASENQYWIGLIKYEEQSHSLFQQGTNGEIGFLRLKGQDLKEVELSSDKLTGASKRFICQKGEPYL